MGKLSLKFEQILHLVRIRIRRVKSMRTHVDLDQPWINCALEIGSNVKTRQTVSSLVV